LLPREGKRHRPTRGTGWWGTKEGGDTEETTDAKGLLESQQLESEARPKKQNRKEGRVRRLGSEEKGEGIGGGGCNTRKTGVLSRWFLEALKQT